MVLCAAFKSGRLSGNCVSFTLPPVPSDGRGKEADAIRTCPPSFHRFSHAIVDLRLQAPFDVTGHED
jgi:hypothetical protein